MISTLPQGQDVLAISSVSWVGLGSRIQAVEALTNAVLGGSTLVGISGPSGVGKSAVTREALGRLRRLGWTAIGVQGAADGRDLTRKILETWERDRLSSSWTIGECWNRCEEALQLQSLQNRRTVVGVDSCRSLTQADDAWVLHKLRENALSSRGAVSLLIVDAPWSLSTSVRVPRLTRSEAIEYLSLKYATFAGGQLSLSQGALAKLHAMSRGLPRELDRLASAVWSLAVAEQCACVDREWLDAREDQVDPNPVEFEDGSDLESDWPAMRHLTRGNVSAVDLLRTR